MLIAWPRLVPSLFPVFELVGFARRLRERWPRVSLAPLLVVLLWAFSGCRGGERDPGRRFVAGDVIAHHVVAPAPIVAGGLDATTMSVYLTLETTGGPDTLVAVETALARSATLHEQMDHGGMRMMVPSAPLVLSREAPLHLAAGTRHVMLEGLSRALVAGDNIPLTLTLRRAGRLNVVARVVPYDSLDQVLARPNHAGH